MRNQFGCWRPLSWVALAGLSIATLGAADCGYLPRIGPAPLRFLRPPVPATHQLALPAPAVEPEPDPEVTVSNIEKTIAATPPPLTMSTTRPSPAPNNGTPNGPMGFTAPEEVVSPQMLLKFFGKPANGANSSATAPLDFTPPKPVAPPASNAASPTGP